MSAKMVEYGTSKVCFSKKPMNNLAKTVRINTFGMLESNQCHTASMGTIIQEKHIWVSIKWDILTYLAPSLTPQLGSGLKTTVSIPSMYLAPEGTEQTLFSNSCDFCFDLSGGSWKSCLKELVVFHLSQNYPRVETATQGEFVKNT